MAICRLTMVMVTYSRHELLRKVSPHNWLSSDRRNRTVSLHSLIRNAWQSAHCRRRRIDPWECRSPRSAGPGGDYMPVYPSIAFVGGDDQRLYLNKYFSRGQRRRAKKQKTICLWKYYVLMLTGKYNN